MKQTQTGQFQIFRANGNDSQHTQAWQSLAKPYFAELGLSLSEAQYAEAFSHIEADIAAGSSLLLLYHMGQAAGFAIGQIDHPGMDWCCRPGWGYICEFYIHPAHRRSGAGKALCATLIKQLQSERQQALPGFYLCANEDAKAFYRSCGFQGTGILCERNGDEFFILTVAKTADSCENRKNGVK